MEMLCPACLGRVTTDDGKTARCTIHGGTFQILFNRAAMSLNQPSTPAPQPPPDSPPATLDLTVPVAEAASPPPPAPSGASGPLTVGELLAQHPPTGMYCVQHPGTMATQRCANCGGYMCATCDFVFPDGLHLCPACATNPQPALTPKRKRSMIISFVLAGGATLGMILCFGIAVAAGESRGTEQLVGFLFMLLVLVPSIAGIAVGLGAIDRRRKNSPALWAAVIWNGLLLASFLLLMVVGIFAG